MWQFVYERAGKVFFLCVRVRRRETATARTSCIQVKMYFHRFTFGKRCRKRISSNININDEWGITFIPVVFLQLYLLNTITGTNCKTGVKFVTYKRITISEMIHLYLFNVVLFENFPRDSVKPSSALCLHCRISVWDLQCPLSQLSSFLVESEDEKCSEISVHFLHPC